MSKEKENVDPVEEKPKAAKAKKTTAKKEETPVEETKENSHPDVQDEQVEEKQVVEEEDKKPQTPGGEITEIVPGVEVENVIDPTIIEETLNDPDFQEAVVVVSNSVVPLGNILPGEKFVVGFATEIPLQKEFSTEDGKDSFKAIFKSDVIQAGMALAHTYLIQSVKNQGNFVNPELFKIGNFFYFEKEEVKE